MTIMTPVLIEYLPDEGVHCLVQIIGRREVRVRLPVAATEIINDFTDAVRLLQRPLAETTTTA